jgi:hypothetical protein
MSDKVRIVLHIEPEAAAILDDTVTSRQKGVYISQLIQDAQRDTEQTDSRDIYILLDGIGRKVDKLIGQMGKGA